mmetsp:Transcript_44607/g.108118  ORF Transcript_44607/g.108118 Transcript_44607/m.108118 type:complete len:431 (+) Transcript_44607:176-1468(+)
MKFCKNLQRVVDLSDPSWAPYFTNYKMLKKLIKELPSLVPIDDTRTNSSSNNNNINGGGEGDMTGGEVTEQKMVPGSSSGSANDNGSSTSAQQRPASSSLSSSADNAVETIGKSPGEVAFFKLLHTEFKKATHFFDRSTEEFAIREERVREGMEIMKQPNSIMVNEKWGLMARSIYRLYKDLLLLETFAIMTYCSFSKILKKHDKVTGYDTKNAFMSNIVNSANFTHYPKVLAMISRCERLYEEVSATLLREGKHGLYEDERLFINMIHRLNEQVLDSEDSEVDGESRKRTSSSTSSTAGESQAASPNKLAEAGVKSEGSNASIKVQAANTSSSSRIEESDATSTLRTLVEENDKMAERSNAALSTTGGHKSEEGSGSEGQCDCCDDDDSEPRCHIRIKSESAASLSEAARHKKQEEIDGPPSNKRARLT